VKIVIVHQYYLMPGFPGGSRFNEFARMWAAAGHDVTVIAGNLDYTTGTVPERYRGRLCVHEWDGDVEVWRCSVPKTYKRGYRGRMLAFAGFTLSASWAVLKLRDADVVIATSPPLVAILPAWLARLRLGLKPALIFEIRDLMPESAVATGVLEPDAPLTRGLYVLEWLSCAWAHRINVLTPAFREDLLRRELATDRKIVFIPNGADIQAFTPAAPDPETRRALAWSGKFVIMYAGAHGRANALGQLIETAARLRHRSDIQIACVGDGPERPSLMEHVRAHNLGNISFHGPVPKERMPAIVQACDVGAAVLQRNPTFRTVYPNKVFDYMACQRPVLLGIDGVARQLVCEEARAGVFAEPEDAANLARQAEYLADNPIARRQMGENGRRWVMANATRESLAARYLDVMQELAMRRGSVP
jgi:glycosyltransferase involved in cell wall biosynthesis